LYHITSGGKALEHMMNIKKWKSLMVGIAYETGVLAMRHRLHIGTIVSDAMMKVKFMSGGLYWVIEEWVFTVV
jgi:ATP-dependent Lhr-like helicase